MMMKHSLLHSFPNILKHAEGREKQIKSIGMINITEYEDEIDEIINDKYGETLPKTARYRN